MKQFTKQEVYDLLEQYEEAEVIAMLLNNGLKIEEITKFGFLESEVIGVVIFNHAFGGAK